MQTARRNPGTCRTSKYQLVSRKMNIKSPFELATIGRRIEYTGNMANASGFGAIVSIEPADQWGGPYCTIALADGREFRRESIRHIKHISEKRGCMYSLLFTDEFADTQEVAELIALVAMRSASETAKKEQAKASFAAEVERLKAENPELEVGRTAKIAAANCRKLLKKEFPGVKFSVRSGRATWSSTLTVEWTDGPTTKQVKEITGRFSAGRFDGMEDIYKSESSPWTETFGSAEYVSENRNFSDALIARAIEAVAEKYGATNKPTVEDYREGRTNRTSPFIDNSSRDDWQSLISQAASQIAG